eukprot:502235-Prymnesium_polylepis.1
MESSVIAARRAWTSVRKAERGMALSVDRQTFGSVSKRIHSQNRASTNYRHRNGIETVSKRARSGSGGARFDIPPSPDYFGPDPFRYICLHPSLRCRRGWVGVGPEI